MDKQNHFSWLEYAIQAKAANISFYFAGQLLFAVALLGGFTARCSRGSPLALALRVRDDQQHQRTPANNI